MSKLALLLAVPVTAGLVVWNVSLTSDLAEMRQRLDEVRAPAEPAKAADNARPAAAAAETRSRAAERATEQVTELAARLAQVEARLPSPPAEGATPGAPPAADAPVVPADVVATFGSEAFKGAVAKVLDDRDLARRRERMENGAEARAKFLLRDVTVTDPQRDEVKRVILATMERRDEIRQDESIQDEQRRIAFQELQQREMDGISAALDAQSAEAVRQRAAGGIGGALNRVRPGGRNLNGERNGGGRRQ